MPTKTTTVTRETRLAMHDLNMIARMKESASADRVVTGSERRHEPRPLHRECDACVRALPARCINVVIGDVDAVVITGPQAPDLPGRVTVRYHEKCYPKDLAEWLNWGYGHRRSSADGETSDGRAAPVRSGGRFA